MQGGCTGLPGEVSIRHAQDKGDWYAMGKAGLDISPSTALGMNPPHAARNNQL
jgi:hypothetical protein